LWGESIITSFMGRTERAQRRARRALRITEKYSVLAILITYLPIPFPAAVVYAAVGMARMRLWVFMLIHLVGAGTAQAAYLYLGWSIGEPAVAVVKTFADYMWYLTMAILVGMLVTWWWRNRNKPAAGAPQA
jgi:membrane protein DedA with SNARE-associated domain